MRKHKAAVTVHPNECPTFTITDDGDGIVIKDPRHMLGKLMAGTWVKVMDGNGKVTFMHLARGTVLTKHRMAEKAMQARRLRSAAGG